MEIAAGAARSGALWWSLWWLAASWMAATVYAMTRNVGSNPGWK